MRRGYVLLFALAGIALGGAAAGLLMPEPLRGPETVRIEAAEIDYRPIGNFRQNDRMVTSPLRRHPVAAFDIMRFQVSKAEYAQCVEEGGCAQTAAPGTWDYPQTQVSWSDATAYAEWLSRRTGETWRLPTPEEWQRAAAERFSDDGIEADGTDPSARWLSQYQRGSDLRRDAATDLRASGGYGQNALGVADIGGPVWEWTDGCMENATLGPDGDSLESGTYCGVRIAGGRHRALIIDFVRDASVGGCAVGLPPDYLGFRLVRET